MQATTAGYQPLFKLGAVGWRWSARRADRRLSAQRVFFVAIILYAALTVL
jgi:hypothetical protein